MKKLIIISLILLTACLPETREICSWERPGKSGELYHKRIVECLRASQQPTHNHEDNNGHIVEECRIAAAYSVPSQRVCITVKN